MSNSFTDKSLVYHIHDDSEGKKKLEKRWGDFFQDYRNAIRFNLVHLCPSMLLFYFAVIFLCCSTVLSGYCNVQFYFLGILAVMTLHHFAWHSPFKLYCEGMGSCQS